MASCDMMPDPARSRVERRWRLAGRGDEAERGGGAPGTPTRLPCWGPRPRARSLAGRRGPRHSNRAGFSLLELMFVSGVIVTAAGISMPLLLSGLDAARTRGAARYLAGRLNLARMEAVKRSAYVAVRVEGADTGYRYTFYVDGNRNGVRTRDIAGQIDRAIGPAERLGDNFSGVVFGILEGVTAIDLLSFSPVGSATAGTFYLHGQRKQQMAVRVLGVTGRVRVLRFDFSAGRWTSQ
jgi:Tfp pilus assembly protein FimT